MPNRIVENSINLPTDLSQVSHKTQVPLVSKSFLIYMNKKEIVGELQFHFNM